MLKRTFLLFSLCFVSALDANAAPYHMDAPINAYTWGESQKAVWEKKEESPEWQKISEDMILIQQEDGSVIFLRFWHDKLRSISKSHSRITQAEREVLYKRYLRDFTAKWGPPDAERLCPGNAVTCAEIAWKASEQTRVSLFYSTPESDQPFVGYSYSSSVMLPEIRKELNELGVKYPVGQLVFTFEQKPEYAEKTLKGKRVRIAAPVVNPAPLELKYNETRIRVELRNKKEAGSLNPGELVLVSGVVAGMENATLQLSDAFLIPFPQASLMSDRKGRPFKGAFSAATLYSRLAAASRQTQKDFVFYENTSRPRKDGAKMVVDLLPNQIPGGMSFSLGPLYADQSADTIAFNVHLQKGQSTPHWIIAMIGFGTIIKASQPDQPLDAIWGKIEDMIGSNGTRMINGWTYRYMKADDRNFTFSATAPETPKIKPVK